MSLGSWNEEPTTQYQREDVEQEEDEEWNDSIFEDPFDLRKSGGRPICRRRQCKCRSRCGHIKALCPHKEEMKLKRQVHKQLLLQQQQQQQQSEEKATKNIDNENENDSLDWVKKITPRLVKKLMAQQYYPERKLRQQTKDFSDQAERRKNKEKRYIYI